MKWDKFLPNVKPKKKLLQQKNEAQDFDKRVYLFKAKKDFNILTRNKGKLNHMFSFFK